MSASRLQRLLEMVSEKDLPPEKYRKIKPKVVQHLQTAVDWTRKNIASINQDMYPRSAFQAARNLAFTAQLIAKVLGDTDSVRKLEAADEALRKSAVQWPED